MLTSHSSVGRSSSVIHATGLVGTVGMIYQEERHGQHPPISLPLTGVPLALMHYRGRVSQLLVGELHTCMTLELGPMPRKDA